MLAPAEATVEEASDPWDPAALAALARTRGLAYRTIEGLARTPPLLMGTALLVGFGVLALYSFALFGLPEQLLGRFAWQVNPYPPGPSRAHPFGIMAGLGVDVAHALLVATPWDIGILGSILGVAALTGTLAGASAGYFRGPLDWVVTGLVDLLLAVPPFFLVVILYLGTVLFVPIADHLTLFVLLFAFVLWPYYARPVRARAQSVTAEPYIESARASGSLPSRTLWRHVLPNSLGPALAQLPIDVYQVFFVLTVFPFLACFGNDSLLSPLPSTSFPEWGNLLARGVCYGWSPLAETNFWWMYAFPALAVVLFGIAVALTADGLGSLLATSQRR
ncbi:MAG: ABC transporter permease subunit [Thermoplasmata archaeon]|nr:ABC transporter permease subunit [Thermoplasmata archaeon]MCI4337736.1 ABC transporter permease subunit [Thermoplasmata archaeon]MCI4340874.1 ABC transporter permease subunit [Thermoplasmata archaeon]